MIRVGPVLRVVKEEITSLHRCIHPFRGSRKRVREERPFGAPAAVCSIAHKSHVMKVTFSHFFWHNEFFGIFAGKNIDRQIFSGSDRWRRD